MDVVVFQWYAREPLEFRLVRDIIDDVGRSTEAHAAKSRWNREQVIQVALQQPLTAAVHAR